MSWSPFDAAVMADPAAGHQTLLQQCPVHRCDDFDPPFYTLSRYEDVEAALRDIDTYSSEFGQGPRFTEPQGMLSDPPQHTELRALIQSAFAPRAMNALRPTVETLTHELIDRILEGDGAFDLHDDFAFPLPVVIIAGMLGVPEGDLERFKHWSDVQVAAMGAEDPSAYAEDQAAFFGYMTAHLDQRRGAIEAGEPVPEDLLTTIAGGRYADGTPIDGADALSMLMQLLVGGNETTTSLITNMIWRLLEQPELWRALREDRSLIDAAIEESLRYDPPVLGLYRNTTRAVTLHDVTIPAGAKVLINYAAANRDVAVFEDPDRFDLKRPRKRHMAFGLGLHMCIGAPMARMEAAIALGDLLDRLPDLRLTGPGTRIAPFFLWGPSHAAGCLAVSGASPSLGGWLLRDVVITLVFAGLLAAAQLWNQAQPGWLSASAAAVVGFLTAYVVCYLAHEWGHWAGARLSGSTIRIGPYKQPLLALVDTGCHSHGQFLALSWGGIIGYALVTAAALASYFLWLPEAAGAGLAIGGLAFASQSLCVDLPQVLKVHAGADPTTTNAEGANAAIILRRTWQSWSVLALALIAWAAL